MSQFKTHKTVEQIAKKHRVGVSFIQKQLDMGEPIEHEHTKDHDLAMDIALQHLDEIPDYYTRLKQMEASAKKENKKFKGVKEDAGDGIDDMDSPLHMPPIHGVHVDHEKRYCPKCKKTELRSECKYGPRYWDLFSLPGKLSENKMKLVDKILSELQEEDPCWKGYTQVGMKTKKGRKVPNCVPSKGVEKSKGYKKEDVTIEDADGNTFAEVVDIIKPEPIKGFKSQVSEATRMQAQTGNVIGITLSWRGKYYSLKMFFPQVKLPTRKEINDELQKVYPGSVVVYHSVSEIQPGQPLIQVCGPQGGSSAKPGPNLNYIKPMGEEIEVDEDWQKVNRQDRTDGLSQKAVNAYRRENPGSNLQTAVTTPPSQLKPGSADWKRRRNFCSRSRSWTGERGKAARKRWNCN